MNYLLIWMHIKDYVYQEFWVSVHQSSSKSIVNYTVLEFFLENDFQIVEQKKAESKKVQNFIQPIFSSHSKMSTKQLKAIKCPSDELSLTNCAVVNPAEFEGYK